MTTDLSLEALSQLAMIAVKGFLYSVTDTMEGREDWTFSVLDLQMTDGSASATLRAEHRTLTTDETEGETDPLVLMFKARSDAPLVKKALVSCILTDTGSMWSPSIEIDGRMVHAGTDLANAWLVSEDA